MRDFPPYTFDLDTGVARWPGGETRLTAKEAALAVFLFENLGRPLTRVSIQAAVWGRQPSARTRTMDTHAARLRDKLELSSNGFSLRALPRFGYLLERARPVRPS